MSSKAASKGSGISRWCYAACVLLMFSAVVEAQKVPPDCLRDAVLEHVRAQFAKYGPLSRDREYFGFIYFISGKIDSAVVKGHRCWNEKECAIDPGLAAALIPKGAKVLGEWHTHPHESGAETLSPDDVRGAYDNRRIRCYAAFYSEPHGAIHAWDPHQSLVKDAMASRLYVGDYSTERPLRLGRSE